jgi:epoxyqueuosine reductase
LGNAWREHGDEADAQALAQARDTADPLVREHIDWALAQRALAASPAAAPVPSRP